MHSLPSRRVYEVALYNKEVRAMVKENRSHTFFDDQWADTQLRDVIAQDEGEARAIITTRFPPEDGFVIEQVTGGADESERTQASESGSSGPRLGRSGSGRSDSSQARSGPPRRSQGR